MNLGWTREQTQIVSSKIVSITDYQVFQVYEPGCHDLKRLKISEFDRHTMKCRLNILMLADQRIYYSNAVRFQINSWRRHRTEC